MKSTPTSHDHNNKTGIYLHIFHVGQVCVLLVLIIYCFSLCSTSVDVLLGPVVFLFLCYEKVFKFTVKETNPHKKATKATEKEETPKEGPNQTKAQRNQGEKSH